MATDTYFCKPRAATIDDKEWANKRQIIETLYLQNNLKLKDVIDTLRQDYGFAATDKQYKRQFAKWNLRKNVSSREMDALIQSGGTVTDRGTSVKPAKIRRYERRRRVPFALPEVTPNGHDDGGLYLSPSSIRDDTTTTPIPYSYFFEPNTLIPQSMDLFVDGVGNGASALDAIELNNAVDHPAKAADANHAYAGIPSQSTPKSTNGGMQRLERPQPISTAATRHPLARQQQGRLSKHPQFQRKPFLEPHKSGRIIISGRIHGALEYRRPQNMAGAAGAEAGTLSLTTNAAETKWTVEVAAPISGWRFEQGAKSNGWRRIAKNVVGAATMAISDITVTRYDQDGDIMWKRKFDISQNQQV